MESIPAMEAPGILTFSQALAQGTELAKTKLSPTLHGRLTRAVALVEAGYVWLEDDGQHATVQSYDSARWHSVNAAYDCKDAASKAEGGYCQHRLAVGLVRRAQKLMCKSVVLPEPEVPAPSGIDPKFIVLIQNKPVVRFAGLLQRAHERGLQALRTTWTYNDAEWSLAHAVAVFPFGTFEECGDATPSNTNKKVSPHFRRCALTRASARALRLALGVDLVAVEELAEEEPPGRQRAPYPTRRGSCRSCPDSTLLMPCTMCAASSRT